MRLLLAAVLALAAAPPLKFSKHAKQRMKERKVSEATVREIVETVEPFEYRHEGKVKLGYYREPVFVATAQGVVITVINNVKPDYVERLRARGP